MRSIKVEFGKAKELDLELAKSKEVAKKLQEELDKHIGCLSNKAKENKMLNGRVSNLEKQVKDVGRKMDELSSKKKTVE